jgi:endonuclease/exonuclease/phosphatase family metal-dependent hydrolase
MKVTFIIFGIILFGLIGLFAWCSFPWSLKEKRILSEISYIEPEGMVNNEESPSVIKIQTWNLGFLYGEGSEGTTYIHKDKKFYEDKLTQLVAEIKSSSADVLFLQEIDFESMRSAKINQAKYLALKANYPYVAEAITWEANYIPFPYWPVSRHFGQMKSGGAVLSKYPIISSEVVLLNKPKTNPWWYNLFYLHRYFQKVQIQFGEKKINLVNVHLEAFDKDDRKSQIESLVKIVQDEKVDIVAGDFNMVPASATKRSKFINSDDNYENDLSYEVMMKSNLGEVIPDEIYAKNESEYFTYPSSLPDRRLDYVFYEKGLKMIRAEVLPSALSDHLPLKASFQIGTPKFNPYSQ